MKPNANKEKYQRLINNLKGSDGIVYLMFLGRDTYAAKIKPSLVGTIYKHDSNTNQAVKRLLRRGSDYLIFQRKYQKEKTPGRKAEIYTASFDPIFHTLNAFNIDFDAKILRYSLECLSAANASFPNYLTRIFEISFLQNSPWHLTLANYFHFISELLLRTSLDPQIANQIERVYSFLPVNIFISKKNVNSLVNKYPDMPKKFRSMALRMSLPKIGLNSALYRIFVENLPNIDENFFKIISAYSELEDFLKLLRSYDMKSIMDNIERLRETREFLRWKLEKEKKKES